MVKLTVLSTNEKAKTDESYESPQYVRTSIAAAMTLGIVRGKFFRNAKLYCLNLLLTYDDGCAGKCAYCGLSRERADETGQQWREQSFIRVDWPVVALDEVKHRMNHESCAHVERVCVSMVTRQRARKDTISIVESLHETTDRISVLMTPTIINKEWLFTLKRAGADMVGIAIDAATPELFEKFRGRGVGGPHRWEKYWKTVEDSVEVFGKGNVGVHLIVGLGETEQEMVETIQRANDLGAMTHLFSFFPEEKSPMQDYPQPPLGHYRRIQLARHLINQNIATCKEFVFNEDGQLRDYGVDTKTLAGELKRALPFMTSGCRGKTVGNACNRPYANCTPHQADIGELRNFPFQPDKNDIQLIKKQLWDYSLHSTNNKSWVYGVS